MRSAVIIQTSRDWGDIVVGITPYALLAGVAATIAGLILQAAGRALFSRYKRDDTKELAGVVGLRVSAIFSIAVGLIFASSAAHLMEAKSNLQEEARLIGTLQILAAEAPTLKNRGAVQENLREFAERSVKELDEPNGIDGASDPYHAPGRIGATPIMRLLPEPLAVPPAPSP